MKQNLEKAFVTPLPVFIIATYDEEGNASAMNAAWCGQAGSDLISISLGAHPSTENIKRNREFTVSYATAELIEACDYVGMVSAAKVPDKLARAGLTVTRSSRINAPIINELPVAVECRVMDITEEYGETRVVAQILGVVAEENVLTDGKVDLDKLHIVTFDSVSRTYRAVGNVVAGAWDAGKKFM